MEKEEKEEKKIKLDDEIKIKFETNEEIKVYEDFESMNLS